MLSLLSTRTSPLPASAARDLTLRVYLSLSAAKGAVLSVGRRDEAGEGVVSTAIAVLIMAALGALMWVGFQELWGKASSQTDAKLDTIAS